MRDINLYFIRHGETEWNLKEQMQGSQNSPLTDKGILGAKLTGKSLRDVPFLQAYSSPQQRAIETRDYIIEEFNTPVAVDTHAGLREMDFGIWEGLPIPELRNIPEFGYYMHDAEKFDPASCQGEGFQEVLERLQKSLDDIVMSAPQNKGNILIVSHGTALRLLLCVINGGDWHRHRDDSYFPKISNTSVSVVNYRQEVGQEQGTYSLSYYNNLDHL